MDYFSRLQATTVLETEEHLWMKSVLSVHWKDWCWSWSSNTLATWCEELTLLKRPWCWERLKAGEEGDDRGWDGWMASLTRWTWVWVNAGSWWWSGRPGVLQSMGSQRVRHDWATELNRRQLPHPVTLDRYLGTVSNYKMGSLHKWISKVSSSILAISWCLQNLYTSQVPGLLNYSLKICHHGCEL